MKSYLYCGNIITANSKQEAIQQIIASDLFRTTINDEEYFPKQINKEKIVEEIVDKVFGPSSVAIRFSDNKGNEKATQIPRASVSTFREQVQNFIDTNWTNISKILNNNLEEKKQIELRKHKAKDLAKKSGLVAYEKRRKV